MVAWRPRQRRLRGRRFRMRRNELRSLNLPIADELAKRSGATPRVRPRECAAYAIAGVIPALVFSPRTLAEAAKIITTIAAEGATISIRGGGTKALRPPHPYAVDVVLDTARCSGVLEHTPADLTVTALAGTPVAELQEALRAHGQFFPADVPFAHASTIGGMLASGAAGALRQQYGAPRDNVLGMRVCLSDGSVAFTGSKVVKSVAGYDIPKLFVGARGTLGLIGEVTLKVAPLPRDEAAVTGRFARCEDASAVANRIARSPLWPLATTLHDRACARRVRMLGAGDSGEWTLVVRCGGTRSTLARQVDLTAALFHEGSATSIETLDADRVRFGWNDVAEAAGGATYPGDRFLVFSIASLPTHVPAVCSSIAAAFADAELTSHPASGLTFAHVPIPPVEGAAGVALDVHERLARLEALCQGEGHTMQILAAPPSLGRIEQPPLPPHAPVAMMRALKASFDPSGTFDPGRFVSGI
jgi:glycolate dehydrogenase FAD-binding subunit